MPRLRAQDSVIAVLDLSQQPLPSAPRSGGVNASTAPPREKPGADRFLRLVHAGSATGLSPSIPGADRTQS